MGLCDEIYVDKSIIEQYNLSCSKCKTDLVDRFQTKSFLNCSEHYFLSTIDNKVRLFFLCEQEDKQFWHEYTKEEIKEMEKEHGQTSGAKFMTAMYKYWIEFGGYWKEEAWLPKNREKKSMGELPHQWVRMYTGCKNCKEWNEFNLKFTDGILEEVQRVTDEESN